MWNWPVASTSCSLKPASPSKRATTAGSAELCSHAVFAEPENAEARELQACALEQLGYQAESAVWRNLYLVGAHELRDGPPPAPKDRRVASADVARALSIEQLWDAMGARLDGPRAWDTTIKLAWDFTDVGERWSVTVENGALSAVRDRIDEDRHAKVTLTRAALDAVLLVRETGRNCSPAARSPWRAMGQSWASSSDS